MNAVTEPASAKPTFDKIGLPKFLLSRLKEIGYEVPSPIQAGTIPLLLEGRDLVGQAQTGTGKTAAFALPALASLDAAKKLPQVLVLTPTRELSIQVAEAFQTYASHIKRFSVLPIYGGQDYRTQLNAMKRGPQVIVSTPGRLIDHIKRGNLSLSDLKMLVLDEADEMLRMGFIDDVQWILEQTPAERQIALFSATMPAPIKRIAKKHLDNPVTVEIKSRGSVVSTIHQRYWPVQGVHKLDALTRILDSESVDAVIVFVRTKIATSELADKLSARGLRASALNGEMPQKQREQTVDRLRKGRLDILVATDVAARGLDVERISHVINYDIPYDTESYVHRIGRTGRAGRSGEAILFVAPRERRMLGQIEKAIGSSIEKMKLPTQQDVNEQRAERLGKRITETLAEADLSVYKSMIEQYLGEHEVRGADVAAALAHLLQQSGTNGSTGNNVIEMDTRSSSRRGGRDDSSRSRSRQSEERGNRSDRGERSNRTDRFEKDSRRATSKHDDASRDRQRGPAPMPALEAEMERFRLEVGHEHGAKAGNIVGAVANEGGIDSQYIGRVSIHDEFTLIDLPEGMPKAIFKDLKKTRVCGKPLRISRVNLDDGSDGLGVPDSDVKREKNREAARAKTTRKREKHSSAPAQSGKSEKSGRSSASRTSARTGESARTVRTLGISDSDEKPASKKRKHEKTKAKSKAKTKDKASGKTKSKTGANTKTAASVGSKLEVKAKPAVADKVKSKAKAKSNTKSKSKSKSKVKTKGSERTKVT